MNLMQKDPKDSLGIISLTTAKLLHLDIELLKDWVCGLGVKEKNVVIGLDKQAPNPTAFKMCSSPIFAERLKLCIEELEVNYVLLILDDYKLFHIENEKLNAGMSKLEKYRASVLKLVPNPTPDISIPGDRDFGMCSSNTHWRINTQPTIFLKKYLKSLLFPGETLWEFEINSGVRSLALNGNIISPYKKIVDFQEIIKGGKCCQNFILAMVKNTE